MIDFYNSERERCRTELDSQESNGIVFSSKAMSDSFLTNIKNTDKTKISWSAGLDRLWLNNIPLEHGFETRVVMYRPFCKKFVSFNTNLIERLSRWLSIFPEDSKDNLVICTSGIGGNKGFSTLITNCIQDVQLMFNCQCYPLYMYDKIENCSYTQMSLFESIEEKSTEYKKRFTISDIALTKYRSIYGDRITKEDIFYYLYAVLHSKDYISSYGDNLAKEMVRIPTLEKFPKYVEIGRQLAELHLNYEAPADVTALGLDIKITKEDYTVNKMRFKKNGKDNDKGTIIFNDYITISNIPERAYEYVVNGRSAIEWIMESYRIKVDKDSGITDDPNTYGDEKYILNLLISVINVSLKTLDLIDTMPEYKEI